MPLQYSVPQFIDVENKVIGPISVRQFVIVAVEIGLVFVFYKTMQFSSFILCTILTLIIAVLFAFVKINGRPFHYFMLNFLMSVKNPHLRVWRKELTTPIRHQTLNIKKPLAPEEQAQVNYIKSVHQKERSKARLSDLSLLVDTGGYFKRH